METEGWVLEVGVVESLALRDLRWADAEEHSQSMQKRFGSCRWEPLRASESDHQWWPGRKTLEGGSEIRGTSRRSPFQHGDSPNGGKTPTDVKGLPIESGLKVVHN